MQNIQGGPKKLDTIRVKKMGVPCTKETAHSFFTDCAKFFGPF